MCSTPFGIIGIRTLSQHVHQAGIRAVLNAFRHHRNSHPVTEANGVSRVMCSTPLGIIGIRTGLIDALGDAPKSAQRLSASSEFAPDSTGVLSSRSLSAQRLSASSEFALSGCSTGSERQSGAQRLSASSEFAQCSPCKVQADS